MYGGYKQLGTRPVANDETVTLQNGAKVNRIMLIFNTT